MKVRLGENPVIRSRAEGDAIRLSGGTKTLKKLFIDKKIPASERSRIPVLADDAGVAAVWGIGPDCDRKKDPNWEILLVTL
jgi:tRNA(Ile)-lysidine synthase